MTDGNTEPNSCLNTPLSCLIGPMKSSYFNGLPKLMIRTIYKNLIRKTGKLELEQIDVNFSQFNINARQITEYYYNITEDHVILRSMSI